MGYYHTSVSIPDGDAKHGPYLVSIAHPQELYKHTSTPHYGLRHGWLAAEADS